MTYLPATHRRIVTLALAGALLSGCTGVPKSQPGLYASQEHRFSLSYPANWTPQPLMQDEVLRAANPTGFKLPVVTAAVADLRQGVSLDPAAFTQAMSQRIPGSSEFNLLSQQDLTLNDSTPAKAFTFEWLWTDGKTKMVTAALVATKAGKFYNATATSIPQIGPGAAQLLTIVKSWKFY